MKHSKSCASSDPELIAVFPFKRAHGWLSVVITKWRGEYFSSVLKRKLRAFPSRPAR